MCNGGTSKSKSAEALRLSTVRSVSASASIATRTWDNRRLPSFAPLEEIIWRRVETKPAAPAFMPLGRKTARGPLLIGGCDIAMIFADVRLRGVMDGIDLAREVKMRWPLLPVILTSGHPRESVGKLPPGVAYMPKPWQPLNVLIAAEQALASGRAN